MKQDGFTLYAPVFDKESSWVILDYGDVVLHIFLEAAFKKYNLLEVWDKAPKAYIYS